MLLPVNGFQPLKYVGHEKNLSMYEIKTSHHGKFLKQCLKEKLGYLMWLKPRGADTRGASFLNGFKNRLGKACINRQLCFCERWKSADEKKHYALNWYARKSSRTRVLNISASNRGRHGDLFQSLSEEQNCRGREECQYVQ